MSGQTCSLSTSDDNYLDSNLMRYPRENWIAWTTIDRVDDRFVPVKNVLEPPWLAVFEGLLLYFLIIIEFLLGCE